MTLFRIRRHRPLHKTLRKVFAELVARVDKELAVSPLPPTAVHEARKSVKRLRALVSLVAHNIGRDAQRFDRRLRDVNLVLSDARDATVAMSTLEALAVSADHGLANDFTAARAALDRRLAAIHEHTFDVDRDVLLPLRELRRRWQRHDWPTDEWAILEPNLRRTYRDGRKLLQAIDAGAPAERLHDLRKLTKRTQYHAEFLMPIGTPRLQTEHDEWEHLADQLGQHHDLWVLEQLLRTMSTRDLTRVSRSLILGEIRQRVRRTEEQIHEWAPLMYAERPRAFADRWYAYWKHWSHGRRG